MHQAKETWADKQIFGIAPHRLGQVIQVDIGEAENILRSKLSQRRHRAVVLFEVPLQAFERVTER
eukprot:2556194-Rhodomonas_salina.1